jgi:hypothetical protein
MVEFRTIYPGWYPGRTVHIHVIVHVGNATLTSQLYFPDELTNEVLAQAPYSDRSGRDTTNYTDEIFPTGGGPALVDITPRTEGYIAAICLVLPSPAPRIYVHARLVLEPEREVWSPDERPTAIAEPNRPSRRDHLAG